jgi:CheY-like chemotaxis protein
MTSASPTRILDVDDDPAICRASSEVLSANGYLVATAGSRADAMAEVARANGAIDALILDIGLPDADGADVARDIADQIGQRPTLYVSGWAEDFWQLSDAPGRWRVRQKPIPIPWLLEAVRWLADGGEPPAG